MLTPSFKYEKGKKYEGFVDAKMRRINKDGSEFLIVDLLGNLGGVVQTYLMGYFIDEAIHIASMKIRNTDKPEYKRHYKRRSKDYLKFRLSAFVQNRNYAKRN